jgi:hypothetical protein
MIIPEEMRLETFNPDLDRSTRDADSPSQHQRVGGSWVDKNRRHTTYGLALPKSSSHRISVCRLPG